MYRGRVQKNGPGLPNPKLEMSKIQQETSAACQVKQGDTVRLFLRGPVHLGSSDETRPVYFRIFEVGTPLPRISTNIDTKNEFFFLK